MLASLLVLELAAPGVPTATTSISPKEEIIVVRGGRTEESAGPLPHATSALRAEDIGHGRPTLSLAESLAQVPGVFATAQTNFSQDTRISVRGFGARSAFGIRGIRVLLDGIPLTLPDGQSQVDSVDPANLGRIEVLRGPSATLYGNAAGGVLLLETKEAVGPLEAEVTNLLGAFGTWKLAAATRARLEEAGASVSLFASRTVVDGFRTQSATEQLVAQGRVSAELGEAGRWTALVHYVNAPIADDPGALTRSELRADPQRAADANLRFDAGESVSQLQAGTSIALDLSPHHRVEASAHAGLRDFVNALPGRAVDFTRDFYGGLLVHRWREPGWLGGHRLSLGVEIQAQEDRRTNQGNDGGRADGEVLLLQSETAESIGLFAQERWTLLDPLTVLGSVRYDRVGFEVRDDLRSDGDASGRRDFEEVTAQGGVVLRLAEPVSLFASLAQSYETPTLNELVVSGPGESGLSPTLRAQDALTYEVGARGGLPGVAFEAAVFLVELENELIARENAENRTFFVNAGRSRRIGAEAFARWTPWAPLELTGAYTWLRATFEDDEGGRAGKAIPGLPEHRVFGRLRYDDGALLAAAELEWVDARPVDDVASARAPPHTLAELRAGLRVWSGPWQGELSFGVRNLFDVRWVDNVRINAFGGRFYEPGPPLHVFGLLALRHGAPPPPRGGISDRVEDDTPGRRVDRPLALSRSYAYPAAE